MKLNYHVKIILALFFLSIFCFPQLSVAAEIKVATVSLQEVLAKSTAGKNAQTQLEAKVKEFQDKFSAEQEELEAKGAEIEKKRTVWSPEVQEEKVSDYQTKLREFQFKTGDAEKELKKLEKKLMEPILKNLHEIIAEYGKKENYTMIFENTKKGLESRTGLLFAPESIDITDKVLKLLDEHK